MRRGFSCLGVRARDCLHKIESVLASVTVITYCSKTQPTGYSAGLCYPRPRGQFTAPRTKEPEAWMSRGIFTACPADCLLENSPVPQEQLKYTPPEVQEAPSARASFRVGGPGSLAGCLGLRLRALRGSSASGSPCSEHLG